MNKKIYPLIALAAMALPLSAAEPQTGSGETDGYRLVWQDLFDSGELTVGRWNIEVNGNGGGNNELQYYTDRESNVRVGDDGRGNGCLILTARRESYKGKSFTSGRINSMGLFAFTHGKVEASIRFPQTANGLWPAFWMMGNDYSEVGWPRSGEIDIVEMGHSNGWSNGIGDRFFNGACHWGQSWPNASYAKDTTKAYSLQDGEFHLFTLIWDENTIAMYVDLDRQPLQTPYYKMDIPHNAPDDKWSPGNYFHKENFILFDLAVGGNFTGIHNPNDITALHDGNSHEASMYVNYVKVYQKGDDSESLFSLVPSDNLDNTGVDDVEYAREKPEIDFDGTEAVSEGSLVEAYDISGRKITDGIGSINMSLLPAGIYILTAFNGKYKSSIKARVK